MLSGDAAVGAVAASCGSAGTWALMNEFGFAPHLTRTPKQLDGEASLRNGWLGVSLVSFSGRTDFKAFTGEVPLGRGKKRIVTNFEEDDVSLSTRGPWRTYLGSESPLDVARSHWGSAHPRHSPRRILDPNVPL